MTCPQAYVCGTTDIGTDFRLIAATNRELKKAVSDGLFREDLYFRLNVVSIELLPLRKRTEDILPLCQQALVRYGREFGKEVMEIDPDASCGCRSILIRETSANSTTSWSEP